MSVSTACTQDGSTALICAAVYGNKDVADLLIKGGARVQHKNNVSRGKGGEGVPAWARRFAWCMVCSGLGLTCRDGMSDHGEWVRVVVRVRAEVRARVPVKVSVGVSVIVRVRVSVRASLSFRVRVRVGVSIVLGSWL